MPEMPEFIVQLEQASGLPWWCLLLVAVLALLVIILAVSLSNEKRRNRKARVDIPRGATAPVAADETIDLTPEAGDEATGDASAAEDTVQPVESAAEAPDTSDEADEVEPDDAPADEPAEAADGTADDVHDADDAESDAVPDEQPDEAKDAPSVDTPEKPAAPKRQAAAPAAVEVVDDAWRETTAATDLNDEEILKAVSGSHARMGQSAFGIDFGFLEEYESEYEHALEEFRRLRVDLDDKALPQ